MSGAPIEVIRIRPYTGGGSIQAFVDLRCGGITIRGAKIIRQEGQKAWLAMPAIKTDRAWCQTVELSKPLRERVTEAVLAAWEAGQ